MSICSVVMLRLMLFFFFKQKTAYEMHISDGSSDVCSSDLANSRRGGLGRGLQPRPPHGQWCSGARCADCCRLPGARGSARRRHARHPVSAPISGPCAQRAGQSRPQSQGRKEDAGCGFTRRRERIWLCCRDPRDRKSTRLNSVTNAHLVCRLLLEKKKKHI